MSLVSPESLTRMLPGHDLRLCDVRWYLAAPDRGAAEYRTAHLPGAVFVDLDTVLTAHDGPGRHPLPRPADFTHRLGSLGISAGTTVVAYDDSGGGIAARLWWMLRSIGHRAPVFVLDGGYSAWVSAGFEVTDVEPSIEPTPYPTADRWTGTVDADGVAAAIGRRTVIDARAGERFRGEVEPIDPRAGHIPSARNLPHTGNLGYDGRHLMPSELAARFADVGEAPIVYCGSGVTACHDLLAMSLAGIDDALLYPGSWSDWASRPERPIETGP